MTGTAGGFAAGRSERQRRLGKSGRDVGGLRGGWWSIVKEIAAGSTTTRGAGTVLGGKPAQRGRISHDPRREPIASAAHAHTLPSLPPLTFAGAPASTRVLSPQAARRRWA